eukprot:jgi/Tetstr1/454528/TSEL_041425.t1
MACLMCAFWGARADNAQATGECNECGHSLHAQLVVTGNLGRGPFVTQVERRLRKCRVGTNWLTSLAGLTIEQLRTWDGFSDWHKVDEQHSNRKSVRDFLITDLLLITKIAYLHGIPKSARHKYRGFWNVVADTPSIAILLNPHFISHRTDYFPDREKYESHTGGEDSRHFKVEKAMLRFNNVAARGVKDVEIVGNED